MNIFYVDKDPRRAAQCLVNAHVVKMILETAQLLSTAHRLLDGQLIFVPVKVPIYLKDPNDSKKLFLDPYTDEKIVVGYKDKLKKHWVLPDAREDILYKASHINHPSAIWTRTAVQNYNWLVEHFHALCDEYSYRYDKEHITRTKLGQTIQ